MRMLFLDVDGVLNCKTTTQRFNHGYFGVDPFMVLLLDRIIQATGCQVVLSSSWRHHDDSVKYLRENVCDILDLTGYDDKGFRGNEIKEWLENNKTVQCATPTSCPPPTRAMCQGHKVSDYAILDDDSDMLSEQKSHFFHTSWEHGLTEDIAKNVIDYFLSTENKD